MWDQHALEAWLEESARRDEDALVIQKYKKQDDSKIKELQLLIEKLTDDRNKARRGLESETTETLTSQIELEKLAEEFKRAHSDRQDLITTWETTISKLKERDNELVQEEMKNVDIKEELIAREQIIKEKRAFLSTESENNIELEKKIEIRERQNGKIREQRQYIEARTTEMADSVKTLQHQAERARKENDIKLNQIEESKIKIDKMESKLSQSQSSKREIEQRIDEVKKGMMNAAEIAKQADAMLSEKEQEMKELEQQKRRARDIMFKKTQQLKKTEDTEKQIKMEIHGAKTGIKNLTGRLKKLDSESIKSQEIIYNQDFNIAQLERRIARMQGEVNNEEKTALEEKLAELNGTLEEKHKTKKILDEQQRKLQVNLRRCQVEMEKCTREHDALNSKIEELELYDDSSQRELKSLIKEKQDAMVENNILKLQVKRVRDSLYNTADNVHDLKHRCLRLTTALKERKVEIQQNINKITQEVKHADEIKSQLNMEVHNRVSKIDKLKKRYEIITLSMRAPEGEEEHSQAYHVIKAAQEKENLQRTGDELHGKIQKAEREVEGLRNTLDLVSSGNDRLRRGNRAVGAQDDDKATYAEFEKSHRSHFETLQYKQRVKKDLEEDLHLLSDGLNEAEGHRERTMAELELQESNRLQLQKELDSHIEKVQRVNRQISRLEREITSKHGEDSDFYKTDIRLRTLRDISRAVLRTMSKLRETHPEMAYQIDQTIMNVGLRLPTPSPSQSPANSARSISSRTSSIRSAVSSKSNLPIGSARTQRSDIQAQPIKQVELGLGAELPSPPGSMTSRSVQSSASSKKSTKSHRSRDYA
jgi:UDP-glucose:O-linked fucose beta-1,3-glucosyltransferase